MLKERDLVECVKDSLKGYIDNVTCLQAILDGIDQNSINQALANEYASTSQPMSGSWRRRWSLRPAFMKTGYRHNQQRRIYRLQSQIHKGCGKCERSDPRSERQTVRCVGKSK